MNEKDIGICTGRLPEKKVKKWGKLGVKGTEKRKKDMRRGGSMPTLS